MVVEKEGVEILLARLSKCEDDRVCAPYCK